MSETAPDLELVSEAAPDLEPLVPARIRAAFLSCLLGPDARRARTLIEEALEAQIPATSLYLEVISPAMHEVGRLWETAQIGVAQEQLATQITRAVMAALAFHVQTTATVAPQRVAVVSTSPGEMHALGGQIVADFLEAQGWAVSNLGPDTPIEGLVGLARERNADLVALSTKLSSHLLSVTRTCQLLRQLPNPPYIVVGGWAYRGDGTLALAVGADSFCDDPQQLLGMLGQRFGLDAPD